MINKFNKFRVKTFDPFTQDGKGTYTNTDWAMTRKKSEELFRNPNDFNYLASMFSSPEKIRVANRLNCILNFKNFHLVGDIGGLPFFHSIVLSHLNPHLKFISTDFDNDSLNIINKIGLLKHLNLYFLDVKKGDFSSLNRCDLITMWGVDPCLEDQELESIFIYIKKSKGTLIMCSLECDKFIFRLKSIIPDSLKNFIKKKSPQIGREHIILRSSKYFKFLAERNGLKIEKLLISDIYCVYKIY